MDWLNYHQLLNFWLVAREGSLQRASELLHVTPSSVSIQIRQLERALGTSLFKKRGRNLVLTEMGQQVSGYASEIFAKGRELVELVKGRPVGRPLELRVGVRDVMPKLLAYQLLRPALQLDQPTRLICHEGEMSQLISDLAIHKLDVVLCDIPLDPLYKVRAYSHQLGESDVVIVGTKEYAKRFRRGFPASLDNAPFLLPSESSILRRQLERWFSDLNLVPSIRGEFADSAMMKIAGVSGLGLLAIPAIIEDDVRRIYRLQRIGLPIGVIEQFYAVSVERKIKHPGVLAIRQHAEKASAVSP
jgi:LysR family transcriptional activator of nhaA